MNRIHCFNNGSLTNNSFSETESEEETDANSNKIIWSHSEDEKLKHLVTAAHGDVNWEGLSFYFPEKSAFQCKSRWEKKVLFDCMKGPWTAEEDQKILDVVRIYGYKSWGLVASTLYGRNSKQCRDRWHNHLDPRRGSSWAEEEDRLLCMLHSQLGNQWAEIAKYFPGRTADAVKDHWNSQSICRNMKSEYGQPLKRRVDYQLPIPFSKYRRRETTPPSEQCLPSHPTKVEVVEPQYKTVYHSETRPSVPYSGATNFYAAMNGSEKYGHMTTFELLSGTTSSTPIKFSKLNSGSYDKARIDETSLAAVTSYDGLIPLTSKALKQPCILRRKRRKSNQENVGPPLVLPSPKAEPSSECDANLSVIFNQLTPLKTPVKHLPFSPSRFFNSPGGTKTSEAITSTPVHQRDHQSELLSTPSVKQEPTTPSKSILCTPPSAVLGPQTEPHTPTPFKKALANLEKKSGVVRTEHHTPMHIHDDLQDVIAQDTETYGAAAGSAAFKTSLNRRFGSYRLVRNGRSVQQNLQHRLSAVSTSSPGFKPETPSKSLFSSASLNFSPPSILKETLSQSPDLSNTFASASSRSQVKSLPRKKPASACTKSKSIMKSPPDLYKPGYLMVACGKTDDQLLMTDIAKGWMRELNSRL